MSTPQTPPTPAGIPLFGNGLAFLRRPLDVLQEWASLDDVVDLDFPGQDLYLVSDPALVGTILEHRHESFTIGQDQRSAFEGAQEDTLVRSVGEQWERQRAALQPAFDYGTIERSAGRMVAEADALVEGWEEGERIDLYREMRLLALSTVAKTVVDVDVGGKEELVLAAGDAVIERNDVRRLGQFLPHWVPTPFRRRFRRTFQSLEAYVGECLDDRSSGDDEDPILAAVERGDLTEKEARRNVMSLLLVGHTSPGVVLTYAWHCLSANPDVYDSLVEEYDDVVGAGRPGMETYAKLDRTCNVVDETLRLYPALPLVVRQAAEPVTLDGYEFPAGAEFMLSPWVLQRDGRFWDDPETFDPSRWEADADRPDYAYFPFSGGPRHCIGRNFSRVALVLLLATMIGRVELDVSVDGPLALKPSLTLKPENHITATVHHR